MKPVSLRSSMMRMRRTVPYLELKMAKQRTQASPSTKLEIRIVVKAKPMLVKKIKPLPMEAKTRRRTSKRKLKDPAR